MLFVGHAETGIFINNWYVSQRYPKSFIVRKIMDDPVIKNKKLFERKTTTLKVRQTTSTRKKPTSNHAVVKKGIPVAKPETDLKKSEADQDKSEHQLAHAKHLADSGNLIEAEAVCLQYLEQNKHDKEAYYLLSLIQLAAGDASKAVQYFKNVVYLDPKHYDALMYLSTLMSEQGDEPGASRYRERAQRIKNRLELKQVNV
jgi:chemotaxis protein methyltransferase WspC